MSNTTVISPEKIYTITELSKEFNVTTRAIRFYEDQGLLTPERHGRKRVYKKRDRTRLKLTLRGKRLGLSLSEIRELFAMFDGAHGEQEQLRHYLRMLDERRATLEQQRKDIDAILADIQTAQTACTRLLMEQQDLKRA